MDAPVIKSSTVSMEAYVQGKFDEAICNGDLDMAKKMQSFLAKLQNEKGGKRARKGSQAKAVMIHKRPSPIKESGVQHPAPTKESGCRMTVSMDVYVQGKLDEAIQNGNVALAKQMETFLAKLQAAKASECARKGSQSMAAMIHEQDFRKGTSPSAPKEGQPLN